MASRRPRRETNVDAVSSPVKEELKSVAVSSDLQAIMARRRQMADDLGAPNLTKDSSVSLSDVVGKVQKKPSSRSRSGEDTSVDEVSRGSHRRHRRGTRDDTSVEASVSSRRSRNKRSDDASQDSSSRKSHRRRRLKDASGNSTHSISQSSAHSSPPRDDRSQKSSAHDDERGPLDASSLHDAWGGLPDIGESKASNLAFSDFGTFPAVDDFGGAAFAEVPLQTPVETGFDAFSLDAFSAPDAFDAFNTLSNETSTGDVHFSGSLPAVQERVWNKTAHDPAVLPPVENPSVSHHLISTFKAAFVTDPGINPLTKGIVYCQERNGAYSIIEIDPDRSFVQTSCLDVISTDFRKSFAKKHNASFSKIAKVLALACGLQSQGGKVEARVALMLDVAAVESSKLFRVVGVWNWRVPKISLQFLVTPPSGGDFSFDSRTFRLAEGLLFLGGSSPKGPCIFMCRPSMKETWSANFLGGSGRVSCLEVVQRTCEAPHYLAAALDDGHISIWTFDIATSLSPATTTKRWLYPVCRLDYNSSLRRARTVPMDPSHADNEVSFQTGFALFHVELPVLLDESTNGFSRLAEPTASSKLSQSPQICPLLTRRWSVQQRSSSLMFESFNSCSFGLSCLLIGAEADDATLLAGQVMFPSNDERVEFDVRCWSKVSIDEDMQCLSTSKSQSSGNINILCRGSVMQFSLATQAGRGKFYSLHELGMVSCSRIGLASDGEPLRKTDGALGIFTVLECKREREKDTNLAFFGCPRRRTCLCKIESSVPLKKIPQQSDTVYGEDDVRAGAGIDFLCDLSNNSVANLYPRAIKRHDCSDNVCAVVFGSDMIGSTAVLVDFRDSGPPCTKEVSGRDIVFISTQGLHTTTGCLLSKDGSSLSLWTWNRESEVFTTGDGFRPILGLEVDDKDFLDCRQLYAFHGNNNIAIMAVSFSRTREAYCLILGEFVENSNINEESLPNMLPNFRTDRSFWLDQHESFVSLIGLESDATGYRNFAVSTSSRVLVLSSALTLASEVKMTKPCSGLVPMGSFVVAFGSDGCFAYLSCLSKGSPNGRLVTSTSQQGYGPHLLGVAPDRIIVALTTWIGLFVEWNQQRSFSLPCPVTLPALLLEPLLANSLSIIQSAPDESDDVLKSIVERFGRKLTSITHAEKEGVGSGGLGITAKCFQMLRNYGHEAAASWLLTGTSNFERSSVGKISPSWLPMAPKLSALSSSQLHVLTSGDEYLNGYIQSPETKTASILPSPGDPCMFLCMEQAKRHLNEGDVSDCFDLLDFAGDGLSESLLLQLLLSDETSKEIADTLSSDIMKPASALDTLALVTGMAGTFQHLSRKSQEVDWTGLAPGLQLYNSVARHRNSVSRIGAFSSFHKKSQNLEMWSSPCNEARHIWNEGPNRSKESLLLLDTFEDWLGRRRPLVVGFEGVHAARDRGENALADILQQDDSFGEESETKSEQDNWVEGIGEGRTDEANLCAYFRMSEGEGEDEGWRHHGFQDLSPFHNTAKILGPAQLVSLEESTSGVDEGEAGKVKSLYDLVLAEGTSLSIPAPRGSSLDIGVLHAPARQSRMRCSVEFWFRTASNAIKETILVRRTLGGEGESISGGAMSMLWELVLLPSGSIEFRTCDGSMLSCVDSALDLVRWNHVCVVLSSRDLKPYECNVSVYLKGIETISASVSLIPPGIDKRDLSGAELVNNLLLHSSLVFALYCDEGFRLTEVRVWGCARSAEDTLSFLREYLTAAESKKKFKVKISSRQSKTGSTKLAPPKATGLAPPKGLVATSKLKGRMSLKPPPKKDQAAKESGRLDTAFHQPGFGSFKIQEEEEQSFGDEGNDAPATLWDTALPLSQQVRSSAAAALIRGPPATRHFGGNRGGLPDFSGMERFGVGGIAICGSEKTIVWRDNEDPPALTYPIGASGAIVSDQMDDMGSEFLCCFLARERRMVVFELQSRTVVVELQMTTKLNFWRYLPPEAAENTLCFILITPVGGFHWMPLEESPRPHQVWKRGVDLQGKKVVSYEEGGSNGLEAIQSRVGLVMVSKVSGAGFLESWIVPISGDSNAVQVSDDVMGSCLCRPPFVEQGPFLPLLVTVHNLEDGVYVNVLSVIELEEGSVELGEVEVTEMLDLSDFHDVDFDPPSLAMGSFPEAICCSLSNILVVIIRRKGLIAAFELEDDALSLIAQEGVGHYIVDAVMRYSAEVGGAEIVMLLSDTENPKDGRIVSFCFRSAA